MSSFTPLLCHTCAEMVSLFHSQTTKDIDRWASSPLELKPPPLNLNARLPSDKPFPLLHQASGGSHHAFSAAAQSLLRNAIVRERQPLSDPKDQLKPVKTVNGLPSMQDELDSLFRHKNEPKRKTSPHRGLFASSATAGDHQRIWAGQQNYKAATKTVKINPAFQTRLSANLSFNMQRRQLDE